MYSRFIIILSIALSLYSCSNKGNTKHVGKSSQTTVKLGLLIKKPVVNIHTTDLQSFLIKSFSNYKISDNIKNTIPIRMLLKSEPETTDIFSLTKTTSINYGEVSGVYPKMNLFMFRYSSVSKTDQAFSIWIKSIGDTEDITILKDKKYVKTAPIYSIKSEKYIMVLYYLCEHVENDWNMVKQTLNSFFQNEHRLIMNIECGGPLSWDIQ